MAPDEWGELASHESFFCAFLGVESSNAQEHAV